MNIDEGGLTTLVNKFIREKLEKQERKQPQELKQPTEGQPLAAEQAFDDSLSLIIGNEMQERGVVKCLLIYGIQALDEKETMGDYIFRTLSAFHFDNPLLEKIYNTYKAWYDAGIKPTEKSFLYYGDEAMNNMVISLLEFPYELSPRWELMKDGERHIQKEGDAKPKVKMKEQVEKEEEDRVKAIQQRMEKDVRNSTDHFMLHKLKHMLEQNQQELLKTNDPDEQRQLLELHIALKKYETDITKVLGTVILR